MNVMPLARQLTVVAALCEGSSIRAAARIVGAHHDTVTRLGVRLGRGCAALHDKLFQRLRPRAVEVDEVWSFVHTKQARKDSHDPRSWGDQYAFIGIDADKKAVISYLVGKRNGANTAAFALDLRRRVVSQPQISSDGWQPYVQAIKVAFGPRASYAMIVKTYQSEAGNVEAKRRYSPGRVTDVQRIVVSGKPDPERMSTAFVERQNLSVRMAMRRCTRLTNAFSKVLANHEAAFSLYVGHYNLVRRHETLRTTPAVACGVADHEWTVRELIERAGEMSNDAPTQPVRRVSARDTGVDCEAGICRPKRR